MAKAITPDAAESNAGDDFHILWTIKKCLDLLNFNENGLKAVSVEGVTHKDNLILDQDDDVLLGVDLTEYYGGEDLKTATKVVVSQLKYSTRHPNKNWTVSRICTGKRGKSTGSIIQRLASFYKGLSSTNPRLLNLEIKLVSNRPACANLLSLTTNVKNILIKEGLDITYAKLKVKLTDEEKDLFKRILQTSQLTYSDFVNFYSILDFSDCGVDSRFFQKQKLINAISELGSSESNIQYARLHERIWSFMMTEARNKNTIYKDDILHSFSITDISDIFPVKSKFENLNNIVTRDQIPELLAEILKKNTQVICLHGGAGIGKSTLVTSLKSQIPEGSITIYFDCYGEGAYLDYDDKRHTYENAFTQLSNELALCLGTPFLLNKQLKDDQYVREFKKRLEKALLTLKNVNPSSILMIVIDAADNSVTAASHFSDPCFIHALTQISLPEDCKLIVTTRTKRLNSLKLKSDTKEILLRNFSIKETGDFLKNRLPTVSNPEVIEFNKLTKGIPRVMSYIMEIDEQKLINKLSILRPEGKDLNDIFRFLVKQTEKKNGDIISLSNFLTFLICLPRPIPVDYIKKVSNVNQNFIDDISVDLWHGIIYKDQKFSFKDEDFENFLKDNYIVNDAHYKSISSCLLENADFDEYASVHLGIFLNHAKSTQSLLDIVLERKYLHYPLDPIKNKEIYIERTRLAMKNCLPTHNNLSFLKLQMIAAEAAKTNKVLENVLINNPELGIAYGNLKTVQKLYFQNENTGWVGSTNLQYAAIHSRNIDTHDIAKNHLNKAEKWLHYRASLPIEEREKYQINARDIACGAEAVLRISGIDSCIYWLQRWQPKSFLFEVIEVLITELYNVFRANEIEEWLKNSNLRIDIYLLIVKISFKKAVKLSINLDLIIDSLPILVRVKDKIGYPLKSCIISFIEYAIMNGLNYNKVKPFLELFELGRPEKILSFYDRFNNLEEIKHDLIIRILILKNFFEGQAFTRQNLYTNKINSLNSKMPYQEADSIKREKEKIDLLYNHLLPIYKLRLLCVTGGSKSDIKTQFHFILSEYAKDWDISYRYGYEFKFINTFLCIKLLELVFYLNINGAIKKIKETFTIKKQVNIPLFLEIAEKISDSKKFHQSVLEILNEIDREINQIIIPGSDQIDYYTRATFIASQISYEIGKHYFDKIVSCSNGIDQEAHSQINCIGKIISSENMLNKPQLASDFARYVEYCAESLSGWDHFPWDNALKSLMRLDLETTFVVLCQWDHRNVIDIDDYLSTVLIYALKRNYLDHLTAAGLIPLTFYSYGLDEIIPILTEQFNKAKNPKIKALFTDNLIPHIKIKYSNEVCQNLFKIFLDNIKIDAVNSETIVELKLYNQSLTKLLKLKPDRETSIESKTNSKLKREYIKHFSKLKIINQSEVESLFIGIQNETINHYINGSIIVELILGKVSIADQIPFLDILVNLNSKILYYWPFEIILEKLFEKWEFNPQIKAWKKGKFQIVLANYFNYFISNDYLNSSDLKKLATLFNTNNIEISISIKELIPIYLNELSASLLYDLFEFTSCGSSKEDRLLIMEWALSEWSKKIKDNFKDVNFYNGKSLPLHPDIVVAKFIRYNLGHSDKRIRWRACHSLRWLVKMKKTSILDQLLNDQNELTCELFQHPSYTFYWLSAKLYLWITIERLCQEIPADLITYSNNFINELQNPNLNHSLITSFIKSVCTELTKSDKWLYSYKEKKILENTLAGSSSKKAKQKKLNVPKTKFHFDSMDTLPYWFKHLGQIFGVSEYDVAYIADKYISQWGFTNNDVDNCYVKNKKWNLTSHRHGSENTIENLQTYLEFHAMFCTAAELIHSKPVVIKTKWDDTFEDWLNDWGICWNNLWLSDLRDPLPLEGKYRNKERNRTDWEWGIGLNDFNNALGINGELKRNYIVINMYSTIYHGKDYETCHISSALIDEKVGKSLLITLQSSNTYEYSIPFEDDKDHDATNEQSHFTMAGWLKRVEAKKNGLDHIDELCNDINKSRCIPGTDFLNWSKAILSNDSRYSYLPNKPFDKLTLFETWNNTPKESNYDDFNSNGNRLLMKKKTLLNFLKSKNKCLIVSCEFTRSVERIQKDYSERNFDNTYKLLYLIYPDGKTETISGNYQIR